MRHKENGKWTFIVLVTIALILIAYSFVRAESPAEALARSLMGTSVKTKPVCDCTSPNDCTCHTYSCGTTAHQPTDCPNCISGSIPDPCDDCLIQCDEGSWHKVSEWRGTPYYETARKRAMRNTLPVIRSTSPVRMVGGCSSGG